MLFFIFFLFPNWTGRDIKKILFKKERSENNLEKTPSEDSNKACVICFENQPDAVLMNCGHGGICHKCAVELWKKTDGLCHLCRKVNHRFFIIELYKFF